MNDEKSMKTNLENYLANLAIFLSFIRVEERHTCVPALGKNKLSTINLLKPFRVQRESSCSDMEIPRIKLPCPAKYIPGRQKNSSILIDPEGFRMAFKKKEPSGLLYYACPDKSCNVRVTVKKEGEVGVEVAMAMVIGVRGEHNHDNTLLQDKVNQIVQSNIKRAVEGPYAKPRITFSDITRAVNMNNETKDCSGLIPTARNISQQLSRKRKLLVENQPLPKDWDDLTDIPEKFKMTTSGEEFLVINKRIKDTGERVIGFSSPQLLEVLNRSSIWSVDGTFEVTKYTFFGQCWIFVARIGERWIAVAWFLLPTKTTLSYETALQALIDKGVSGPMTVHLDFEIAEHNAFKEKYPGATVAGCDFHFKQALKKNLKKFGLGQVYNTDSDLQVFFRKLWALSMVAPEDIVKNWNIIAQSAPEWDEDLEDNGAGEALNHGVLLMKNYFTKTFVGEEATKTRSVVANGGVVKRKPPRFSHSLWNHASRYMNQEEVTSNQSESYNSSSKASLPSKANIFAVMQFIQNEESMSRSKLVNIVAGTLTDQHPGRSARMVEKRVAMSTLVKLYKEVDFQTWLVSALAVYEKQK